MEKVSMMDHFSIIEDPRKNRTRKHKLIDIIVLAVCGVISKCDTWVDIEEYGNSKLEWFKCFLDLPNGIPAHDTFGRVFSLIDPLAFQKAFYNWVQSTVKISEGEIISLDGKFISSSIGATTKSSKSMMGMVSAWASQAGVALAQQRNDFDKKHEKKVFADLIDFLNLKGTIVTIDANGCHANLANKIINKEGDYFLGLKKNQKAILKQVQHLFACEKTEKVKFETKAEKGHGRIEKRTCYALNLNKYFMNHLEKKTRYPHQDMWNELNSACKIISERTINGRTSIEERFYISSLKADAEKMMRIARSHWNIENKLHWTLDVAFDEDHCRVRTGFGAENFAILRRLALNLIRQEKTSKRSMNGKRLKCSWDNYYLSLVEVGRTILPLRTNFLSNFFHFSYRCGHQFL